MLALLLPLPLHHNGQAVDDHVKETAHHQAEHRQDKQQKGSGALQQLKE